MAGVSVVLQQQPSLHIVAIGINEYKPFMHDLEAPVNDAKRIATVFRDLGENRFREVKVHLLIDDQASLAGVEGAFSKVSKSASKNDVFVFFFAGMTSKGDDKGQDFILFTHGVSPELDSDQYSDKLLSTSRLRLWLSRIPAQNQLLLIDGCGSENGFNKLVTEIATDNSVTANLLNKSLVVIGPAGLVSDVGGSLNGVPHGSFTLSLIESLNRAGRVDVNWKTSHKVLTVQGLIIALPRYGKDSEIRVEPKLGGADDSIGQRGLINSATTPIAWSMTGNDFILGVSVPVVREGGVVDSPPKIEVRSPVIDEAGISLVNASTVFLVGVATDDFGIIEMTVNDSLISLSPDGRFWAELSVESPDLEVTIRAWDTIGQMSEQILSLRSSEFRGTTVAAPRTLLEREGRDQAILFATDDYVDSSLSPLHNPIADAEAIAEELESTYSFGVEIFRNPSRVDIIRILDRYVSVSPSNDGQLFVFFAGHGSYHEQFKEGYVITHGALMESREGFLSFSELGKMLDAMPFQRVLLALDVCFGGAFLSRSREALPYDAATPGELVQKYAKIQPTRIAITSGAKEYVSDGFAGSHSPFAFRFLEALRSNGGPDGNGLLLFDELVGYIQQVRGPTPLAGGFGSSEPGGTFFFARQ